MAEHKKEYICLVCEYEFDGIESYGMFGFDNEEDIFNGFPRCPICTSDMVAINTEEAKKWIKRAKNTKNT